MSSSPRMAEHSTRVKPLCGNWHRPRRKAKRYHCVTGLSITIRYCLDLRQTSSINPHAHLCFLPVKHSGTKIDMTKVCQNIPFVIPILARFSNLIPDCPVWRCYVHLDGFSFGATVPKNILGYNWMYSIFDLIGPPSSLHIKHKTPHTTEQTSTHLSPRNS